LWQLVAAGLPDSCADLIREKNGKIHAARVVPQFEFWD
jgi:hypothetical protein